MAANVSHLRPVPEIDTAIRCGEPVRGDTWMGLGGLANWVNGHGSMIVPWHFSGHIVTNGSTDTYRYNVSPKAQTRMRVWVVLARANSVGGQLEIGAPSGASRTTYRLSTTRDYVTPVVFREYVTSSTGTQEITLDLKASGTGTVTVDAVCCYEQTRSSLGLDTTDYGVDLESLRPRQPILDRANVSHPGVCDAYDNLDARRTSLVQWSVPSGDGAHTASTSYQALFEVPLRLLAPIRNSTSSPMDYVCYAYVKATGGSVFAQATTGAGAVSNSTSSVTYTWLNVGTLSVAAEDLTVIDGVPGGGIDTFKIEVKCGTGSRVDIAGVSLIRESKPQ